MCNFLLYDAEHIRKDKFQTCSGQWRDSEEWIENTFKYSLTKVLKHFLVPNVLYISIFNMMCMHCATVFLFSTDVGQNYCLSCKILFCVCKFIHTCRHTRRHEHAHCCRHEFLLFLCNQLSEQDAWWDRLLADAKSLVMLCGEVK